MFKSNANSLTFIPENGMNVVDSGRISVYEKKVCINYIAILWM